MSTLCFGSFSRILKGATTTSNEFLIELLFTPFYHNDVTIDKADQSKLINSKKNVPVFIQNQADTPAITSMIEQYFRDHVVIHIKQSENYKLISLLVGIINGDNTIPEQQKSAFLSTADIEHLPSFLSDIFLYAIQQPNNLKENPIPPTPTDNSVYSIINGHIYLDGEEIKLPDALIPPENIEIEEQTIEKNVFYVTRTSYTDNNDQSYEVLNCIYEVEDKFVCIAVDFNSTEKIELEDIILSNKD